MTEAVTLYPCENFIIIDTPGFNNTNYEQLPDEVILEKIVDSL